MSVTDTDFTIDIDHHHHMQTIRTSRCQYARQVQSLMDGLELLQIIASFVVDGPSPSCRRRCRRLRGPAVTVTCVECGRASLTPTRITHMCTRTRTHICTGSWNRCARTIRHKLYAQRRRRVARCQPSDNSAESHQRCRLPRHTSHVMCNQQHQAQSEQCVFVGTLCISIECGHNDSDDCRRCHRLSDSTTDRRHSD